MGDLERVCHNFTVSAKDIIYFSVNNWHQPFLDYCEENFGCDFYKG